MEKRGKKREEREKKPGKEGEHFLGFDKKTETTTSTTSPLSFPRFCLPPLKLPRPRLFFPASKKKKM